MIWDFGFWGWLISFLRCHEIDGVFLFLLSLFISFNYKWNAWIEWVKRRKRNGTLRKEHKLKTKVRERKDARFVLICALFISWNTRWGWWWMSERQREKPRVSLCFSLCSFFHSLLTPSPRLVCFFLFFPPSISLQWRERRERKREWNGREREKKAHTEPDHKIWRETWY